MIAIDTNLLVYAHRAESKESFASQCAIEQAATSSRGWGIPAPCVAEFWRVVTHPRAVRPSTPKEAHRFLLGLTDAGAQFLTPGRGFSERLLELAVALQLRGETLFDCQIALTCRDAGADEIWTNDAGFIHIPGLRVRNPLA